MSLVDMFRRVAAQTGRTYHEVCREKGAAGGRKAAFNRRLRKQVLARRERLFHEEQLRQVARGLNSPDALPDEVFTEAEAAMIAHEARAARRRVARMEGRAA